MYTFIYMYVYIYIFVYIKAYRYIHMYAYTTYTSKINQGKNLDVIHIYFSCFSFFKVYSVVKELGKNIKIMEIFSVDNRKCSHFWTVINEAQTSEKVCFRWISEDEACPNI